MADRLTTEVLPPPGPEAWERDPLPSTERLWEEEPEDRVAPLDPTESDEAWTARVLASCESRRRVLGVRD